MAYVIVNRGAAIRGGEHTGALTIQIVWSPGWRE